MFDPATGPLTAAPDPALDRITGAAALCLKAPKALLTILTPDKQVFFSAAGAESMGWRGGATPLGHSVCQHVARSRTVLPINDLRRHPQFRAHPALRDLDVVAYLGAPVRLGVSGDFAVLCLLDSRPRRWTAQDCQLIETLAAAASAHFEMRSLRDERDLLFRSLSHEIRTPLNGVLGGLALLDAADQPAARADYLATVRASAERLLEVAEAMMEQLAARRGPINAT